MNSAKAKAESPLNDFVVAIVTMGEQRKALMGAQAQPEWRVLLEDLAMLTQESVIIGLRTKWARRVAVPMMQAWRALGSSEGTPASRAATAIEIIDQMRGGEAEDLRARTDAWIRQDLQTQVEAS